MKHDDTAPPHSLRGAFPAIKPTVESSAMKSLFEDMQRRILFGQSVPLIISPGNGLEALRFIERARPQDRPQLHVLDKSPLTDDDHPLDIPNCDLLIMRGNAFPVSVLSSVEASLAGDDDAIGDTSPSKRFAAIIFPDRESLKKRSRERTRRDKKNWQNPLVWPPLNVRDSDKRGLIYKMMEALKNLSGKQAELSAEARRCLQIEKHDTVLDLYCLLAAGFRHALQSSTTTITTEHLFLPAEKTPPAPPQT